MGNTVNKDGLIVRFGRDQGNRGARAGVTNSVGKIQELAMEIELTGAARTIYTTDYNNSGTDNGFGGLDTPIPSGAKILSVDTINLVTPAGGTSYAIGTYTSAGGAPTVVDADGLRTDAGADGAQVGTAATANWYVAAVTTGIYTAGKVKVIVRYLVA